MQYHFWLGEDGEQTLSVEHALEALGVGSDALYRAEEEVLQTRKPRAINIQVGGEHYKKYPIQPIEYSMRNGLDACQSYVVKYVTRHKDKGGRQDLEKAIHLIELMIEMEYGSEPTGRFHADDLMKRMKEQESEQEETKPVRSGIGFGQVSAPRR